MPQAGLLRVATLVAEGLGAAHDAGITHRDLKPSNIVVRGMPADLQGQISGVRLNARN